jgi:hypothetical protein
VVGVLVLEQHSRGEVGFVVAYLSAAHPYPFPPGFLYSPPLYHPISIQLVSQAGCVCVHRVVVEGRGRERETLAN